MNINCEKCGVGFSVCDSWAARGRRYCSAKCRWESETGAEAFWAKVDKTASTGCWLWTGCKTAAGYGRIGKQYAHRRSAEMAGMRISRSDLVCHKCDVRHCVNPDHLFLGSPLDNMKDMVSKGRSNRGERCGTAKLTDQAIREIRAASGLQRDIASRFGITQGAVSSIKSGRRWSHIK